MNDALMQSPWQRARELKPKLSSEVQVFRRQFRGEQWYVLRRAGSERLYRLNPRAWQIVGMCNGERSLESVYQNLRDQDPALSESDLLAGVKQLVQQGLVTTSGAPFAPGGASGQGRGRWQKLLRNPLAIRVPLWNPDAFLNRHRDRVAPLFSFPGLLVWALVVAVGLIAGVLHWPAISHNVMDRVLNPANLLLLWCIYPVTKTLHELSHAFAIKLNGGAVHEIGVMFLYGIPLPYVDASDALTFPHRRQRILVDAVGIMAELFIAAIALFLWLNTSDGLVSQLAYNAMIICSVSTIFFNGNPLMRFDGYYLLADFLDMPNLATRSSRFWCALLERRVLGVDRHFDTHSGELKWLVAYAPLALLYRCTVLAAITLLAAQYFLPLGVVLGAYLVVSQVVNPLGRAIQHVLSPGLSEHRGRALGAAVLVPGMVLLLVLVVPVPLSRQLPAVTWLPENAEVRAETDGMVAGIVAGEGGRVTSGDILFQLENPELRKERDFALAAFREAELRLTAARASDPIEAGQLKEELRSREAELAELEKRLAHLQVSSATDGDFYLPPGIDSEGRYVRQGDLLAYVVKRDKVILRVIVGQDDIAAVRSRVRNVGIKLAGSPAQTYRGEILRFIPSASRDLPSPVLGTRYGGSIGVEPGEESGSRALVEWFQVEVEVSGASGQAMPELWMGSRAWVDFDLGYEPIATQLYWALRQLFMQKLQV